MARLMQAHKKIKDFDPDSPGTAGSNLYGLPFAPEEAGIVILPVPWEATVSYRAGTAKGPQAVLQASYQVDLHDPDFPDLWKTGIAMLKPDPYLKKANAATRSLALRHIRKLESGKADRRKQKEIPSAVDKECEKLNRRVEAETSALLEKGKLAGLLGGEHSAPLGFMRALEKKHGSFGILQVDAHMDLRKAYEDFTYSHASIMYNALRIKGVEKLVQVGVRDFCGEEDGRAAGSGGRVSVFTDAGMREGLFKGASWETVCNDIIAPLPEKVYISFDIDGLDPSLCPNTGTPVPGGLSFREATFLLRALARSGRRIIGFDLCEVAPGKDEWDANVGARMLYKLCGYMEMSQMKGKG